MKFLGDYHTHTIYSHGLGMIEHNVIEAVKKGLKQMITDHGLGMLFLMLEDLTSNICGKTLIG